MKTRRYQVAQGDVIATSLVGFSERKDTGYRGEWAPEKENRYVIAQVILTDGLPNGTISLAIYDRVLTYADEVESVTLSSMRVSHIVQTHASYLRWGVFKKIGHEEVASHTPFQLYSYNGTGYLLSLTPFGVLHSPTPPLLDDIVLPRSGYSLTGEAVVDLMRHYHKLSDSLEEYAEMSAKVQVREEARLENFFDLSGVDPALFVQTFFNKNDPDAPSSTRGYGAEARLAWDELLALIEAVKTSLI